MSKIVSYSDIEQTLLEKHDGKRIDIISRFPMLDDVQENVMTGSFSWHYTKSHRKDILRPFAYQFPNFISTPSELARTYLGIKYTRQRATRGQIEYFKQRHIAPLYAQPIGYEQGAYIDIRSAYWQILQTVGWDVDYYPGYFIGKKDTMEDFPFPDFKLTRNCLITAGLPSEANYWDCRDKKFKSVKTFNKLINMGVWALTMDVLHCVAWDAIAAGACYVHTDGYICHHSRVEAVISAIAEWGLEARIKYAGRTIVYGVGSYQVGEKATKNPHHAVMPFDGLELPSYNRWLKTRFRALAERTNYKWSSEWQKSIKSQLSNVSGQ